MSYDHADDEVIWPAALGYSAFFYKNGDRHAGWRYAERTGIWRHVDGRAQTAVPNEIFQLQAQDIQKERARRAAPPPRVDEATTNAFLFFGVIVFLCAITLACLS